MKDLELLSLAWLCLVLVVLGIRVSLYRISGAWSKDGEATRDGDSLPARFHRAHGNLSEWVGAFAGLAILSSRLVLGDRGPMAEYSGILAASAAAGITVHRVGMLVFGLRRSHIIKVVSFTVFYAAMTLLAVRCCLGLLASPTPVA